MRNPIKRISPLARFTLTQTLLVTVALVVFHVVAQKIHEKQYFTHVGEQLHDLMTSVAHDLRQPFANDWCAAHAKGTRVRFSLIARNGDMICDSHRDIRQMDNHANRLEVIAAIKDGFGDEVHMSRSLKINMFYSAKFVESENVIIRTAIRIDDLKSDLEVDSPLKFITLFCLVGVFVAIMAYVGIQFIKPFDLIVEQNVMAKQQTEKAYVSFVAQVSHQLKTPLTAIKGYIDTMSQGEGYLSDKGKSIVEILDRNVIKLIALVRDLLALSKVQYISQIKREFVDPRALTENILQQFSAEIGANHQRVECSYGMDRVRINAESVEQILLNLMQNSVRYAGKGVNIKISWDICDENDLLLKVSDDGVGISRSDQKHLFESFFRGDKQKNKNPEGTGLGLTIVKGLVEKLGGRVWIESSEGKGVAVYCFFPDGVTPNA